MLPGRGDITLLQHVPAPDFQRRDSKLSSNSLHLHFVSERNLWRAEPPECAVWRSVCSYCASADSHVVAAIRSERVNRSARQHNRSQCHVRTTIEQDINFTRD